MTERGHRGGVTRDGFQSADRAEAEQRLTEMRWTTRILSRGAGFELGVETLDVSAIGHLEFWAVDRFDALVDPILDRYAVTRVHDGRLRWDSRTFGDVRLTGGDVSAYPCAGDRFRNVGIDVDFDAVVLDSRLVAEFAEHVHGVPAEDFRLHGLIPLSPAHARRWSVTATHVRDRVLGNPMLIEAPALGEAAFRMLTARFLTTFPNTALDASSQHDRTPPRSPARTAREVRDHLRAHACSPITPLDLVRLTGRSAADAVAGLRRAGVDPAEILWRARLEGARRDLIDGREADPVPDATDRVAARWGFTHPGRFRISYAREFGETPEDTSGH